MKSFQLLPSENTSLILRIAFAAVGNGKCLVNSYSCSHAIAVFRGRNEDPQKYATVHFTLESFRATYKGAFINPEYKDESVPLQIDTNRHLGSLMLGNSEDKKNGSEEDLSMSDAEQGLLPMTRRPPSKPKNQRYKSAREGKGTSVVRIRRARSFKEDLHRRNLRRENSEQGLNCEISRL
jgi:hypothetical protein